MPRFYLGISLLGGKMKKYFIILLSLGIFANSFAKMPQELYRELKAKVVSQYQTQGERDTELDMQVYAYNCIEKLGTTTKLAPEIFNQLRVRMEKTYPNNYVMQYKKLDEELQVYEIAQKNLKAQNVQAQQQITNLKSTAQIQKSLLDKIQINAEKKYPNDFIEQKKYIEAVLENYDLILKNK